MQQVDDGWLLPELLQVEEELGVGVLGDQESREEAGVVGV